jgi:hypothetical protein
MHFKIKNILKNNHNHTSKQNIIPRGRAGKGCKFDHVPSYKEKKVPLRMTSRPAKQNNGIKSSCFLRQSRHLTFFN